MYDIEEVRMLSQGEGLNDRQIADKLGCSRVTVSRIRYKNNIPTCDKNNRRDKEFTCVRCATKVYIKRKERRQAFCKKCLTELSDTATK